MNNFRLIHIVFCLFLLVFTQLSRQQVYGIDHFSNEDVDNSHPSWQYKKSIPTVNDDSSSSLNRLWKRLVHDLAVYQRQQRFGNTRYGRDLE